MTVILFLIILWCLWELEFSFIEWLIILGVAVITLNLTGCSQVPAHPESVIRQRSTQRTVEWCEVSGGVKRCKQVSQQEMRRALEVLGGQRL